MMDLIVGQLWSDLWHCVGKPELAVNPACKCWRAFLWATVGESHLWACLQVTGISVEGGAADLRPADTSLLHYKDCFTPSLKEDGGILACTAPVRITLLSWEACWISKKWQQTSWMWRCGAGGRIVFDGVMLHKVLCQIMGTSERHFI